MYTQGDCDDTTGQLPNVFQKILTVVRSRVVVHQNSWNILKRKYPLISLSNSFLFAPYLLTYNRKKCLREVNMECYGVCMMYR